MPKRFVLLVWILLSLTFVSNASAQLKKGQMETSFSAAFMGVKESDSDMKTALNLSARLGYFFTRKFEIEPEMIISTYEGYDPGIILSANLLYNVPPPGDSKACPFFLAGIGLSNSLHTFNELNVGDTGRDYIIFNVGLGSKFFLNSSTALRFEYRFQRLFTQKAAERLNRDNRNVSYHNLLFGISIFLR